MSRFLFSVSNLGSRQEGMIDSESFVAAVNALGDQVEVHPGDLLEIGVNGFPPARFECMSALLKGRPVWMPTSKLAA
jgi:hypothetical protein